MRTTCFVEARELLCWLFALGAWAGGDLGGLAGLGAVVRGAGAGSGRGWCWVPLLGADGFEHVAGGGPEVEFEIGFGVAAVQVVAEAGEELGEDGLDDVGPLPVEGFAFVGGELGGHLLPGLLLRFGLLAVFEPSGLAGFPGDGDVQVAFAGGGEVRVAGVSGVEQDLADLLADAGGVQGGAGFGEQGCRAATPAGLGWAVMA